MSTLFRTTGAVAGIGWGKEQAGMRATMMAGMWATMMAGMRATLMAGILNICCGRWSHITVHAFFGYDVTEIVAKRCTQVPESTLWECAAGAGMVVRVWCTRALGLSGSLYNDVRRLGTTSTSYSAESTLQVRRHQAVTGRVLVQCTENCG